MDTLDLSPLTHQLRISNKFSTLKCYKNLPFCVLFCPKHFYSISGPPQRVLSSFLHSFVDSSRSGIPLHPTPLPLLGLSQGDKQCIRDRSSILARHIFSDKSEDFINAQVGCPLFHDIYMMLSFIKLHF